MNIYGYGSVLRPVFDCLRVQTEQLFCPQPRCRTFCLGRVPEYTPIGKKPCALLRPKLAYSIRPRKQQQPHRSACAAYRKRRTQCAWLLEFSIPAIFDCPRTALKGYGLIQSLVLGFVRLQGLWLFCTIEQRPCAREQIWTVSLYAVFLLAGRWGVLLPWPD